MYERSKSFQCINVSILAHSLMQKISNVLEMPCCHSRQHDVGDGDHWGVNVPHTWGQSDGLPVRHDAQRGHLCVRELLQVPRPGPAPPAVETEQETPRLCAATGRGLERVFNVFMRLNVDFFMKHDQKYVNVVSLWKRNRKPYLRAATGRGPSKASS